jgi:general secretion pathway protein I
VKTHRGFTLVELLVALTLFAVVGGTLLQLFQDGLRTTRLAAGHTHAVFLARSKLTELQAYGHLRPGTMAGAFDGGYRWQAVLIEREADDARRRSRIGPLDLSLTVSWGDTGETRSITLRSLLLTRQVAS